jgi:hypothetical protein
VAYLKSLIICYKDTASREQNKTNLFVFYAEAQRIFAFLSKFTASREQNKTNLFVFYAEAQRIFAFLSKFTASREQNMPSRSVYSLFTSKYIKIFPNRSA